jgi:hypothetical protein
MSPTRTLKIHEQGDGFAIRHHGPRHSVPLIRLQGKWLRLAGFLAGRTVFVLVEPGRLTILAEDIRVNETGGGTP